jgi:nicotinamide-nucleotide amidase
MTVNGVLMANAEIVSIGSELLLGQIVDTNAAWMAQRLTSAGVNLFHKTIVGDNHERMGATIAQALDRSDVVITGGGIGPTQDDITRDVIADVTGRKLSLHPDLLSDIERRFRSRGFIMTKNNERQAYIPEGAIPVHNPNGTAPSFIVEDERGVVIALPGVPFEMKWLFDNEVIPYLQKRFALSDVITYRVLKVADMGESAVDERIGHLIADSSNPTVGILAHPGQVDVRIAAKASNETEAAKLIAPVEAEVRELLGSRVFAVDEESMENKVGSLLSRSNKTIAVYEDLTGGLVTGRLLDASHEHVVTGIIGNDITAIQRLLAHSSVPERPEELLSDMGRPTLTAEIARAIRLQAGADLGLALHGVQDPNDTAENLGKGRTVISLTDGNALKSRIYESAGRGIPDRTRMSINAVELVRMALTEGLG